MMSNLKESLNGMGWLDLIFLVPMFLLFSYLPAPNLVSILLNIIIVIFFSFGLAFSTHLIWNYIKKDRD